MRAMHARGGPMLTLYSYAEQFGVGVKGEHRTSASMHSPHEAKCNAGLRGEASPGLRYALSGLRIKVTQGLETAILHQERVTYGKNHLAEWVTDDVAALKIVSGK